MIKAIIFDCFGVLAEDGWTPFKRRYIADKPEIQQEIADLGKANDAGMLSYEEMVSQMAALIGVDRQLLEEAVGRRVPNEELFTYIAQTLKSAFKIGMLSNASYDVMTKLFTPQQAALFDGSVISFETGLTKPDIRMFELIATRLNVLPNECLFIDDVERYCVAAEDAGMNSLWYQDLDQTLIALPELKK